MADVQRSSRPGKVCFVTIGATAAFNGLVTAVLEPNFLRALQDAGYAELRVQYGGDEGEAIFESKRHELSNSFGDRVIDITGFGFNANGLRDEMTAAKGPTKEEEGMVISHAGSGSILDALRVSVPLIVVPNTDLLHNHQLELAEILAEQEYVVHGKLDNLPVSITEVEVLRHKMRQWPPLRSDEEKYQRGLAGVIADEMGWQIG